MHKVLLAVDGSAASDEAAYQVACLAHHDRWDVTVLTVVQRPYRLDSDGVVEAFEKACDQDREFAVEHYGKISAIFDGANVSIGQRIENGSVNETIIETADEIGADLIVVGAKGRSQISRVLLGSVSDHVATHAHCSVWVVRPSDREVTERGSRVCLTYDGRVPSQAALKEIAEIAWRHDTEFHVLCVASYLYNFFGELREDSDAASQYNAYLKQAQEQLLGVAPQAQTHLLESEHVGEGIVMFAEQNDIDLLVLGETPRYGLSRFLLGSTSRYALRHARCSVWITRNRLFQGADPVASAEQAVVE
ncbi:putative universal stress protein [Novipirellula galeiformis]|uniref:Putative universal stress protein n=2 Tax=Novipirellula galeiformis TaxID=2528004 RepID=A0A5C6CEW2_9BACT|nr:putative universal stress protein [Novipirellula galeiformis]